MEMPIKTKSRVRAAMLTIMCAAIVMNVGSLPYGIAYYTAGLAVGMHRGSFRIAWWDGRRFDPAYDVSPGFHWQRSVSAIDWMVSSTSDIVSSIVTVPMWTIWIPAGLYLLATRVMTSRRRIHQCCSNCGYDLTGLAQGSSGVGKCPECGKGPIDNK